MKKKIVRVPLSDANFHNYTYYPHLYPVITPLHPDYPFYPAEKPGNVPATPETFRLNFGLKTDTLTSWTSSLSGYPRTSIQFAVSDSDMPRVIGWFTGNYDNVSTPPSDTLLHDLSEALQNALDAYFAAAGAANLFTSPFRLGWAFRYNDGSRRMTGPMAVMQINPQSPLLAINTYSFQTSAARCTFDILNNPCRITILPENIPADWGEITHIDIIAAPPATLMPKDFRATGTYIDTLDNVRYRCFRYNALDDTTVLGNASMQNDLRILASLPVAGLDGSAPATVTLPDGALSNWKLLPKFTISDDSGSSGNTDNSDSSDNSDTVTWEPYIDRITDPLDLGDPERRKWLWMAALRGCFDRKALRIRIYASRHRQNWHLIADGNRAWVSAMTNTGYRWFRVRITGSLRRRDFLDALSFHITRTRL